MDGVLTDEFRLLDSLVIQAEGLAERLNLKIREASIGSPNARLVLHVWEKYNLPLLNAGTQPIATSDLERKLSEGVEALIFVVSNDEIEECCRWDVVTVLGVMCEEGLGLVENFDVAKVLLETAVSRGNTVAQCIMGKHYSLGKLVPKDPGRSLDLYMAAAEQGNPAAMCNVATIYRTGRDGVVEKNDKKCIEWLERAVALKFPLACQRLAVMCEEGIGITKDEVRAFELYTYAAEMGDAASQINLGVMYETGRGRKISPAKPNFEKAKELYQLAAEQGDPIAYANIAGMYQYGRGVEQDKSEALRLYLQAAKIGGHPQALMKIGWMYSSGQGVKANQQLAAEWYHLAALQGDDQAQLFIGSRYERGMATEPMDLAKACQHIRMAAKQGNANASYWVASIRKKYSHRFTW